MRIPIKMDSRLVFTSKNISAPSLLFNWTTEPTGKEEGSEKGAVGGLRIEWKVEESKDQVRLDNSEGLWVQRGNQHSRGENFNLKTVMNLVRESKVKKMSEDDVWKSLLRHRWSKDTLSHSACLNGSEELEVIVKAAQDLNLVCGYNSWVPEEDLAFGIKLYSSVHYCPSMQAEAAKLSLFFENLLSNHSLNTVVSATMQNIQPKAGNILKDFSAMNNWYTQLERRYNFSSLGLVVTALSSEEQLKKLSKFNLPFVKEINVTEWSRLKGGL